MNEKLLVAQYLKNLLPDMTEEDIAAMLEYPADKKMGDLALPCFKLSKILRKAPPMIASDLCAGLEGMEEAKSVFEKIESVIAKKDAISSSKLMRYLLSGKEF